jgi:hypothetical protein
MCINDVCGPNNWAFDLAGDGPPPDAPITSLAAARIEIDSAGLTAGQVTQIGVVLTPNAPWPSPRIPGEIVVRVREPRGPNLATTTLSLVDPVGLAYAGSFTIPESGDLVLEVALDEDGGDATRFGTSMLPVAVADAPDDGAIDPGSGGEPEEVEGLPPILIALLALAAVVGAGVMISGFRSGSR